MGSRETARAQFRPRHLKVEEEAASVVPSHSATSPVQSIEASYSTTPQSYSPEQGASASSPLYQHPLVPVPGLTPAEYAAAVRYGGRAIASVDSVDGAQPRQKRAASTKQRVKTGCLTCRKRRIKCDEGLPRCSKCSKSRRECIYDPHNRPQSPSPPRAPRSLTTYTHLETPARQHSQQAKFHPQNSRARQNQQRAQSRANYTPLDPNLVDHVQYNMAAPMAEEKAKAEPTAEEKQGISMSHLYMMGGRDPPTPKITEPITPDRLEEIKALYMDEYARGIDEFLETNWYTKYGLQRLMRDERIKDMFAGMVELFRNTTSSNFEVMYQLPSTEARTVWELMLMARLAASDSTTTPTEREDLQSAVARLAVFEHVITGRQLETNPLSANEVASASSTPHARQLRFWHLLGNFTTLTSDGDSASPAPEDGHANALAQLRGLLDNLENRDVLYSIAVTRHFGGKTSDFPHRVQPATPIFGLNTADKNRLLVAKKFLEDEAAEQGTNQVVQRICAMAARSWPHL